MPCQVPPGSFQGYAVLDVTLIAEVALQGMVRQTLVAQGLVQRGSRWESSLSAFLASIDTQEDLGFHLPVALP
jgi:hypothetical protein